MGSGTTAGRRLVSAVVLLGTLISANVPWGAALADQHVPAYKTLINESTAHLEGFLAHERAEAIRNLMGAAKGVVVIPDEKRASLVVGYKQGVGVLLRRHGGAWSDPVFVQVKRWSVGFQVGGGQADVLLCIMTDGAVSELGKGIDKYGGTGGIALGGGIGTSGAGSTSGGLELVAVSSQTGAYLGSALEDTEVSLSSAFNTAAYGKDFDPKTVLSRPGGHLEGTKALLDLLAVATRKSFE